MIPIEPALLSLAAAGLPGAATPARSGWHDRLERAFSQGLAGFLASSAVAGHVDLEPVEVARVQRRLEAEAVRAVQLEGELLRLATLLDAMGAVLLKGPVLAHGAYPDPLLRPFTDLDVLVPGRRLHEAVHALADHGYRRSRPEPAPGFDARIAKALVLMHPSGVIIDLHRTLAAGVAGATVDVDELLAGRTTVAAGTVRIPAPSWEAHLIECSLHAVIGDGLTRALSIRDVAEVARHPDLDAAAAVDLAERWRVRRHVEVALRVARDGLGAVLPEPLDRAARPATGPEELLPAPARSVRARLDDLRARDLRGRVALTRALVVPSPAFLRWTYGDLPLPRLYARRWRSLYRQALDARRQAGGRASHLRRSSPGRARGTR